MLQNSNSDKLTERWEIVRLPSASAGRSGTLGPFTTFSEKSGCSITVQTDPPGLVATLCCTDGQMHWTLDVGTPVSGSSVDVCLLPLSLFCMYSERPSDLYVYHVFCVLSSFLISFSLYYYENVHVLFVPLFSSTYFKFSLIYFYIECI